MSKTLLHVGIDIGSTTVKVIVLDKNQNVVFNHKTKQDVNETRNMLEESARIARLKIKDISELNILFQEAEILNNQIINLLGELSNDI